MPSQIRLNILHFSFQLVSGQGTSDFPLEVTIKIPGALSILLSTEPEWDAADLGGEHPPMVQAIGEAAGPIPMPAKKLATKSGYECNSHFRKTLADMVRAGLLRHGPDGYFLPDMTT